MRRFGIYTVIALGIEAVVGIDTCYFPDGTVAEDDTPCNTTTSGYSACCGQSAGGVCMTSNLCYDNGIISRGSCTDPSWKDGSCPDYCVDFDPSGGCTVVPHSWGSDNTVATVEWCCGFPFANGSCRTGYTIKVVAGSPLPNTTAAGTSTAVASSTALCPSYGALTEGMVRESTCAKRKAAVGAGVGVPLGLVALCALLLLLMQRRKIRQDHQGLEMATASTAYASAPFYDESKAGQAWNANLQPEGGLTELDGERIRRELQG